MLFLRLQFPRLYRAFACLALLAALAPVLVGFVHHPAAAVAPVPMCDMGKMGGGDQGKSHSPPPACPICQTLHLLSAGGIVPPDPVVTAVAEIIPVIYREGESDFRLPYLAALHAQPRAPPVFV